MPTPTPQIRDRQARTLLDVLPHNVVTSKNGTVQAFLKEGDWNLMLALLTLHTLPPAPPAGEDPDRTLVESRLAQLVSHGRTAIRDARLEAESLIWLDDRPAGYYTPRQIKAAARALATASAALNDAAAALFGDDADPATQA